MLFLCKVQKLSDMIRDWVIWCYAEAVPSRKVIFFSLDSEFLNAFLWFFWLFIWLQILLQMVWLF